jgi:hypothetical protein
MTRHDAAPAVSTGSLAVLALCGVALAVDSLWMEWTIRRDARRREAAVEADRAANPRAYELGPFDRSALVPIPAETPA